MKTILIAITDWRQLNALLTMRVDSFWLLFLYKNQNKFRKSQIRKFSDLKLQHERKYIHFLLTNVANNVLFQRKRVIVLKRTVLTFETVLHYLVEIIWFAICGKIIKSCGFEICGLGTPWNLRICYLRTFKKSSPVCLW